MFRPRVKRITFVKLAGPHKKDTGVIVGHCSHRSIFPKESDIIGLLGRRCKTRLRGGSIVRYICYDLSAKQAGQRAPFLTRGSLLSPIVRFLAI